MPIPFKVEDQIADLYTRIAEQERRQQNAKRTGTIHEVDAKKGLAMVMLKEQGGRWRTLFNGLVALGGDCRREYQNTFPALKRSAGQGGF